MDGYSGCLHLDCRETQLVHRWYDALSRGIGSTYGLLEAALRSDWRTRVAPDLEQIMGHTHQAPLTTDVVQTAQQAPTEPPSLFDLAKHRFHDDFAPCVHCTPFRCPHFRRHALLRGGEPGRALSLGGMPSLTLRRHRRIKPQLLHSGSRSRAVIAAIGDVSEVLVCYALGVYETQSNPQANRVIA